MTVQNTLKMIKNGLLIMKVRRKRSRHPNLRRSKNLLKMRMMKIMKTLNTSTVATSKDLRARMTKKMRDVNSDAEAEEMADAEEEAVKAEEVANVSPNALTRKDLPALMVLRKLRRPLVLVELRPSARTEPSSSEKSVSTNA